MCIVAIDGPAGSGKSTVARRLAETLRLGYLDTGAMYRAVAYAVLRAGADPRDADAVAAIARRAEISVDDRVVVDGDDATAAIRGPEVTSVVSAVAAVPAVREVMVERQRSWVASRGGGVVEGRDIGTVVFPGAELKVFLTASDDERARRRALETGDDTDGVRTDLLRRDEADSTRPVSPLTAADDALVIDTTSRSVDDIVGELVKGLEARRR